MSAWCERSVHQHCYFTPQRIENRQLYVAALDHSEIQIGGRVERIRIVLIQSEHICQRVTLHFGQIVLINGHHFREMISTIQVNLAKAVFMHPVGICTVGPRV